MKWHPAQRDRPGPAGARASEHGGAGGAVPAAAPVASKPVARSSASLDLHGAAALPEMMMMSERKGAAVDRQVGKRWRSFSYVTGAPNQLSEK